MNIQKRIGILILLIAVPLGVSAYTQTDLNNKITRFEKFIETKYIDIIQNFSEEKTQKIIKVLKKQIVNFENDSKLSDEKKLKNIALYTAFSNILSDHVSVLELKNLDLGEDKITNYDDLKITIIADSRNTDGLYKRVLTNIEEVHSFKNAELVHKDFSDPNTKKRLEELKIKHLPVFIFSSNKFDVSKDSKEPGHQGIDTYLQKLPNGEYYLPIGAYHNPFEERSKKGYKIISQDIITKIKKDNYIKGNINAEITWIEYSDLECPFCARLHNKGTITSAETEYGDKINMLYQHFPLNFHPNAQTGAEALECIAEQKGSDIFYAMIEQSYKKYSNNNFSLEGFYDIAKENGADIVKAKQCVKNAKYTDKVKKQMEFGSEIFGVTGTPGNVLINNKTGEYTVVSGAVPYSTMKKEIDGLLEE